MYLQNFGLKHDPLGKAIHEALDNEQYQQLKTSLTYLLETHGVGLITGVAGVGKTTAVRQWVKTLNPLTHQVFYQSDNHFKAFDIYSQFAEALGLETPHRYSRLWRNLKTELLHLYEEKKRKPIWILDEAQQMPLNFFFELPSFLNFNFDTREIMTIIFVGTPKLANIMQRSSNAALASRTQFHFEWKAFDTFDSFKQFVIASFQKAGCQQTLLSESGMKLIHMASKGRLRFAHRIITRCLQLACSKNASHLDDDLIKQSIEQLRAIAH